MDARLVDRLHAYWRMEYIEAPKAQGADKGNPFVEIPKAEDDKSVHMLFRGQHTYIVLNRFPYNAGHLLIAPYREVEAMKSLSAEERTEFMEIIIMAQDILTQALQPEGFNIGFNLGSAGGAGIPQHLHCHVVPRWAGDTNFMPVLSNTKILNCSLDTMWERLKAFC